MLRPEPTSRPSRVVSWRAPWLEHALVLATLATLLGGYQLVVAGTDWWLTTCLIAGVVAVVCALTSRLRWQLATPVALLVGLWLWAWVFVPETLVAFVPTWSSVQTLATLVERGGVLAMQEAAPAAPAQPIVLVLVIAFTLLTIGAELLLRMRRGILVLGVVFVQVYAMPAMVAGDSPSLWIFVVAASLWLALLLVRSRALSTTRDGRASTTVAGLVPAVAVGTAAVVGGVLLPPVLPDVTAVARPWGDPPPEVFGRGINPMLQLGQNLRRNSTAVAARYTTTLDDPPYLKVAVLRDFTGETWRPTGTRPTDQFEGAIDVASQVETSTETTDVAIEDLTSTMLPVPYPALRVSGLDGRWSWQRAGLVLSSEESTTEEQTYSVESLQREPTAAQMRTFDPRIGPALEPYVELSDDVPENVSTTAAEVTAGLDNNYDRALALQDHLRTNYRYDEQAPVAQDYDGNGLAVLGEFLERGSGYCVHFASAMAVMARDVGIPARIAVGYAPGSPVSVAEGDDRTVYEVTSNDLHAWPELYFRGVGWVGFEPTPAVGTRTSFTEPQSGQPESQDATQPNSAPGRADAVDRSDDEESEEAASLDEASPVAPRTALAVAILALIAAAAPSVVRAIRRRRRLARPGSAVAWWHEVQDTAVDTGVDVQVAGTPRALAGTLRDRVDPSSLDRVLTAVETARFARPGSPLVDERAATRRVVGDLEGAVSRGARWRARLLPRSLLRR